MCCFTRPVERVEQTRIFARAEGALQLVVYEMKLRVSEDVAMVLPVPTAHGSGQGAIDFVDLTSSPTFFAGLAYAFRPEELTAQALRHAPRGNTLAVQQVGSFEASFVPSARDFDRLDPRFALPSGFWDRVPDVRGFGFVVFKLRTPKRGVLSTYHPMAFWFPRGDRDRLFFPTLHVHDGALHADARFDHVLYAQTSASIDGWETSKFAMRDGVGGAGRELVLPAPGRRRILHGVLPNRDEWINA